MHNKKQVQDNGVDDIPLVWIVHRCQTRNLGDQLLGLGLETQLQHYALATERLEFTGKGKSPLLRFARKVLKRFRLQSLSTWVGVLSYVPRAVAKRPRLIVIGGGQLLLPHTTFLTALSAWIRLAKICDARLALFSVGTEERKGPLSARSQAILRDAIAHMSFIRLRDQHSRDILARITGERFPLAPDTAYGLVLQSPHHVDRIGVGVCPASLKSVLSYDRFHSREEYYQAFIDRIDANLLSGEPITVFSTAWADRREVLTMACRLETHYPENKVEVAHIPDSDALIALLQNLRVVIGSRMHGLILGHILGATVDSISRNDKMASYEEQMSEPLESIRAKLRLEIRSLLTHTISESIDEQG
ncbi:hypothetical protein B1C78_12830 [Thioalkalivibrio denitrificans]|uniref:Polysaccharide pyruvyl transferase domain-containing protein n=1 Tax=Thioalkalivibrio denitrificans TaxID=108003 RepID=A0A1V3NDY3_9GAMM|nr:polysaccharide pyruvyl transferase family protein [Thioalkalivibrio denitrificans]OOG23006.1 hypothetical protein B1C78_12830 [Thioalkalivibrio denitrificans]